MSTYHNVQRLYQIKAALASAIEEVRQSSNIHQDVACVQRDILEAADRTLARGNHGLKRMDNLATRDLFVNPEVKTLEGERTVVALLRLFHRHPEWLMVSGLVNAPVQQVLDTMRTAGINPPLAFQAFLGYYQTEAAQDGTRRSVAA